MSDTPTAAPLSSFVSNVVGGGTPSRSIPANWSGPIPWASVKDFADGRLELRDTQEHISRRGLLRSATNLIPAGTPIVCTRMAVGRAATATVDVAINQDLKALYPAENVDARYLLHGLSYLRPKLDARATGSTVRGITVDELLAFELLKPDVEAQRRVAEVLDMLDRQIELSEALIEKLRVTAGGLVDELVSREAWPKGRLDAVSTVERGKFTHRPRNDPAYLGGPHPFIQTGDVSAARGGVISEASQSLSEKGARVSNVFPAGTVAVTIAANIADTALLGIPMYFPDSVVGVVVKPPNNVRFVELMIRLAKPRLEARAPQSAQRNINLQDLRPLLIPQPSPAQQDRLAAIYDAATVAIDEHFRELSTLRMLRHGLADDLLGAGSLGATP
jgi:type I restriction enzyme, S subunit